MVPVSRGFGTRRRESDERLPPGQYLTEDFPVLSAGPTPRIDTAEWAFDLTGLDGASRRWTWEQLMAMPIEEVTTDIHCVTRWSKLGTRWRGIPLDAVLAEASSASEFTVAHSYGGYTTNIDRTDLTGGKAWIAFEFDGKPLDPEHGGPARLLIPHLYFWKSAKWLRALQFVPKQEPGFWEQNGYNIHGDPWKEERYW